jgi:hypothetical protein
MLNKTLVSLFLSGLYRSSPTIAAFGSLSLNKVTVRRSFSTFAYNIWKIDVSQCFFRHFLDSAINVDRSMRLFSGMYSERPNSPDIGDDIIIKDAWFENCKAKLDGGAIRHFSHDEGTLIITRTTFISCESGPSFGDGGCVYFTGKSSHISMSCASNCIASREGHSFFSSLRSKSPTPNHINSSTIVQCAPSMRRCGWHSLFIGSGHIKISDLNSSNNYVDRQCAAFMMHTLDSSAEAMRVTAAGNSGPWMIYFYAKDGASIKLSNFVANKVESVKTRWNERVFEAMGVLYYHKGCALSGCVMRGNYGGPDLVGLSFESKIIVKNCVFDREEAKSEKNAVFDDCRFGVVSRMLVLGHLKSAVCYAERDIEKDKD